MTSENKNTAAFLLDDRSIEKKLDAFRLYSQQFTFAGEQNIPHWPSEINWAQVLLGFEAGAKVDKTNESYDAAALAWSFVRQNLTDVYNDPELADGQMPPEQAFLLTLLGLLETPQALFNQLPARYRALYYQQMLALKPRNVQADQLTAHFILAPGVQEQVLPAGLELDAGQDSAGTPLRYTLTQPLTVNNARITDLRWVVRDACITGGRRARVILDESAGVTWPAGGVRLFAASPAKPGEPARADADHAVNSGRIIGSTLLAIAGGERLWTVTFAHKPVGQVQAAVSIDDAWVTLNCTGKDNTRQLQLGASAGTPAAVTALNGLSSALPLLRLTDESGEPLPVITKLEVLVKGAEGVLCTADDGTGLMEGGLPFGPLAEAGCGVNLISADWWRLGPKLQTVTVVPVWAGLPATSFPQWYGPDETQKTDNWLLLDANLNVTRDAGTGKTLDKLNDSDAGLLRKSVVNGEDVKKLIPADKGYEKKPAQNSEFIVNPTLVTQGGSFTSLGPSLSLFQDDKSGAPSGLPLTVNFNQLPAAPDGAVTPDNDDPAKWSWHLRFQLDRGFLQTAYEAHLSAPTQVVTLITQQKTTQMVPDTKEIKDKGIVYKMVDSGDKGPDGKTPLMLPAMKSQEIITNTPVPVVVPKAQWHAPYLPQWTGLQVNYTAIDNTPEQQVITPFGYAHDDDSLMQSPAQAELYLGIEGIDAGQLLTLHWQLRSPQPLPLEWQYLTPGERWARLPVSDETGALHNSGNWSVDWPDDANHNATSMPPGRMWLRGRVRQLVSRDPGQVALPTSPWLTGLVTNAATATLLEPQYIQADHFASGLPALQVTQALNAPQTLQEVVQPWPSSGGRAAETRDQFDARVAQRLRHRERGLNNPDLMMLLKEQYPGIRELSVLLPTRDEKGTLRQTMVVMPGPVLNDTDDPQRPRLSAPHLDEMAEALHALASPWLSLTCVNPVYVPVSISWDVSYTSGLSHSTGYGRVKIALEKAFMPWPDHAADYDTAPVIGRAITHSAVRDVLRNVPGVETVHAIYLNGEKTYVPPLGADQVAVLTCIPSEYTGLTLAWEGPDQDRYGEFTLVGDGSMPVLLTVTYPHEVTGVRDTAIPTMDADVWLVDLDSGQRLPDIAPSGPGLWVSKSNEVSENVVRDRACYADPQTRLPENTAMTSKRLCIQVVPGTNGVHKLGVAVGLKVDGVPDVILQSAVVGQHVTLNVQTPGVSRLWQDNARWSVKKVTSANLAAPADWTVTSEKYLYSLNDLTGLDRPLRFHLSARMESNALATLTQGSNKNGGLHPIVPAMTPHAVVGKNQDVVLWYVDPDPLQPVGLDVGSSVGQATLRQAVSFIPDARLPGQLAIYALRLNTKTKTDGKDIGNSITNTSVDCPVRISDVGIMEHNGYVQLQLTAGTPVAILSEKAVEWEITQKTEISVSKPTNPGVSCLVHQYLLHTNSWDSELMLTSVPDTPGVTAVTLKSASQGNSGRGLVLTGPALTSFRGSEKTIHLWWVDPEPGETLGLAQDSTVYNISLGTTPLTFTVPARQNGMLAIYEMQLNSDLNTDANVYIGRAVEDHEHSAKVRVTGWLQTTLSLKTLSTDPPALESDH